MSHRLTDSAMGYFSVKIYNKLHNTSERSKIIIWNILGSFLVKGLSILASLILVPLTIELLNQEKYGVWMTIYSIITWFSMMDVGLGYGFRNKFTEAIAQKDKLKAKHYVQTLYSSMWIVSVIFITIFSIANIFLNWNAILNLKSTFDESIQSIVWYVFVLFCIQLFLKNITVILLALHKTTYSNIILFAGNVLSLLTILILQYLGEESLFSISLAFMLSPIIVYFIYTIYLFNTILIEFRPRFQLIPDKQYLKDIIGLGLKFFFIQITTVIMFSCSNLIITQLHGPAQVTPYSIAQRLFASAQTVLTIIITPFWSAFTEANTKNDTVWIKNSINKLIQVWIFFSLGIILVWVFSPFIFEQWIGNSVEIPYSLSLHFAIFTILLGWLNPFVFYITSVSKIKLELYIAFLQAVITIPLAVYFAKYLTFGPAGVIMATNIVLLIPAVLIPMQYYKIINNKAQGIWNL